MSIENKVAFAGAGALFAAVLGIGHMVINNDKKYDRIDNIKNEIKEKDPERYARMTEKTGIINSEEGKIFLWENAYKEMNDSLLKAAYNARSNYSKASLKINSYK